MKQKKPVLSSEQKNSASRAINKALLNAWRCRADEAEQAPQGH